jgi:peptide chain release factor
MTDKPSNTERVWLQVTSGRGPTECQIAVARFCERLTAEALAAGLTAEVIDSERGDAAGAWLSAVLAIGGEGAGTFARGSCGTVQWIAKSPVRPHHKRKNWFIGVDLLMPPAAGDANLRAADVTMESMRASGPGGQHVNKTESAVRATHRPTGLVAVAREERSQAMNRKLAMARLAAALAARGQTAAAEAEGRRWEQHDELARGDPVRTFAGEEFREKG